MITEKGKLEIQMKKLTGICDEQNLVWSFKKDTYPISLVIMATNSMEGQMSLLADDETNNHVSKDAKLIFSFKDGALDICIKDGTFRVSKALISKLENIFIRMHSFWLQYFHREIIMNDMVKADDMPEVDEDGSDIVDEVFDEVKGDMENIENDDPDDEDGEDGDYEYDEPGEE